MYEFTEEQLIKIAYAIRNSTDEQFAKFEKRIDARIASYQRIEQLITDATHPSFRFGNTDSK
jgi:hypothetical protein